MARQLVLIISRQVTKRGEGQKKGFSEEVALSAEKDGK